MQAISEGNILHAAKTSSWLCGGVCVHSIVSVLVWLFSAIVVLGGIGFMVLEAMDKVESIRKRAPWIEKVLERRRTMVELLLISTVLLIGDGYELMTKEFPTDVPLPSISFASADPKAKDSEIAQLKWENDFLLHRTSTVAGSAHPQLWHMSQNDRTEFIRAILPDCNILYPSIIRYDPKDSDQFNYANEIADVFKGACNTEVPRDNAPNTNAEINSWDPFTGIVIFVQSRDVEEANRHPPASAVALHRAFAELGFIQPMKYGEAIGKVVIVVGKKP